MGLQLLETLQSSVAYSGHGIFLEQVDYEVLSLLRYCGIELKLSLLDFLYYLIVVLAPKQILASKESIDNYSKCPKICAKADALLDNHLRSQIEQSAYKALSLIGHLRQPFALPNAFFDRLKFMIERLVRLCLFQQVAGSEVHQG